MPSTVIAWCGLVQIGLNRADVNWCGLKRAIALVVGECMIVVPVAPESRSEVHRADDACVALTALVWRLEGLTP